MIGGNFTLPIIPLRLFLRNIRADDHQDGVETGLVEYSPVCYVEQKPVIQPMWNDTESLSDTTKVIEKIVFIAAGIVVGIVVARLLLRYTFRKSEDPGMVIAKLIVMALFAGGWHLLGLFESCSWHSTALFFGVLGWLLFGMRKTGELILQPCLGMFTGGREPPARAPVYSIAHSKRSLGHFDEAVRLIREQLNQFPGDIEGFMLLASIQAENLVDLQAAQSTIEHLLNTHPPPQAGAAALFALADWHMSVQDVDSTRATLERIHSNYPSTPMARIAAQRIADMG